MARYSMDARHSLGSIHEAEVLIVSSKDGREHDYNCPHHMAPTPGASPEITLKNHLDCTKSLEHAPPEGRRLFFDDEKRRIDFILAWKVNMKREKNTSESTTERELVKTNMRLTFEQNLEEEGLELQRDIQENQEIQFTKVHAPWEVLTRYAEIMKIRMPIKEIPDEIKKRGLWEMMKTYASKLVSPFELDPEKVPHLPKKFTHVFQRDKEYLFAIPRRKEFFFSHATRSRIVDYILRRKKFTEDEEDTSNFGIQQLLSKNVYTSVFPLHEGSWKPWTKPSMRRLLYENWSHWKNFYKVQPLDYIRVYLGEKIGLYFTWLGFYTFMLIPASIVGLIVFIYGLATINSNVIAKESCDPANNFTMCPLCDNRCPYWPYDAVCSDIRASHMFDNGATVFFACFMSLWGTVFLEFWKRTQASTQFQWNLLNFEEEEEPPRPEYLVRMANSKYRRKHKITGVEEPFLPYWRQKVPVFLGSVTAIIFLCLVAIGFVFGVIAYRMTVRAALYLRNEEILYNNAGMVTSATAACINLIVIFILNFLYGKAAVKLTEYECHRTQSEYDSSLNFKLYVLKFVNFYSSIIYIAFFKGRFVGRPGDYKRLFGARQEECQGGCLMNLCIQLAIIFVGKQLIQNNLMEIFLPRVKKALLSCCRKKKKTEMEKRRLMPWEKDYLLDEMGPRGLYEEYLEMLIQFGFVTLFVAAFPLAPLFAFLNNIIEIRADANKFTTQFRRPTANTAQDIGVWDSILFGISRLAIITNALIIAITSSFIHRLVYEHKYSPDGSLHGYVNNSLAHFNVSDLEPGSEVIDPEGRFDYIDECRYIDYREPHWSENKYEYTIQHWNLLAVQLGFIVAFENVILFLTSVIAHIIPDMPRRLQEQQQREKYLVNEIILKTELKIAHGDDAMLTEDDLRRIRLRARMSEGLEKVRADVRKRSNSTTQEETADV